MGRYGCGSNEKLSNTVINGTTFVTCVPDDSNIDMILGLSIGLGLGIPILCLIMWNIYYFCKHKRNNQETRFQDQDPKVIHITVQKLRRWETFLHSSGYIRRIAQVLEAEEKIPYEVLEYVKEFEPITYEKLQAETDFVKRASMVVRFLFQKQAEQEKITLTEAIKKWRKELVDKCGGEWSERIIDNAATQI
jgi:hypothetical protein